MSDNEDEEVQIKRHIEPRNLDDLMRDGYVVLPLMNNELELQLVVDEISDDAVMWPEFANRDVSAGPLNIRDIRKDGPKYVCGGFGALGNPGSFHCPSIRKLRLLADERLRYPFWARYQERHQLGDDIKLSQIIDRFMCRAKGDKPSAEAWHRDEAKGGYDGDHIFGGWINLNNFDQTFSCVRGTHKPGDNPQGGFACIPADRRNHYKQRSGVVKIPPGHILIFYENIIHEVVPTENKLYTVLRLFTGWRLSRSNEPLGMSRQNLKKLLDDQAVMPLKSGQDSVMYPKLYMGNWHTRLNEWSKMMFNIPDIMYDRDRLINWKKRTMNSYEQLGYEKYPPYTHKEINMLYPQALVEVIE